MYFKINKGTELALTLDAIWERVFAAHSAMISLAEEMSDMPNPGLLGDPQHIGGYLRAIQFEKHPGTQWAELKNHSAYGKHFYYPSARKGKAQDELRAKFKSANDPISNHDFCEHFGLTPGTAGGFKWYSRPGFVDAPECYLVSVADEWAATIKNPHPDMVEILASEYHRHVEAAKAAKAE